MSRATVQPSVGTENTGRALRNELFLRSYCPGDALQLKSLERIFTRHFLPAVIGSLLIAWTSFAVILTRGSDLDDAAKLVDALFKIAAVIVGTGWALNRYFMARTDALQLRVDPVVDVVQPDSVGEVVGLFVCRLDIVNTGRVLTPPFRDALTISEVKPRGAEVDYEPRFRWPEEGMHPGAPIEPGSWSAISVAVPFPHKVAVFHVHLQIEFEGGARWTWHRHFVQTGETNAKRP